MAEQSYYDVLGITQTASTDEVKRAWARKMREHPPDSDPAGNQAINEAKRTLLDPQARKQYDKMLVHGDAIGDAIARAEAASGAGNPTVACSALREVLALDPDCHWARNALAAEQHKSGDSQKAVETLRALVQRAPDVALYRHNLAQALMAGEGPGEESRRQEATAALQQAVAIEPGDADYRVALAQALRQAERYDEAEKHLEAALMTDGVLDEQDVDTLYELAVLHMLSGHIEKVQADARRMMSVSSNPSPEYRAYAGSRFAVMCEALLNHDSPQFALEFANAGRICDPSGLVLIQLQAKASALVKGSTQSGVVKAGGKGQGCSQQAAGAGCLIGILAGGPIGALIGGFIGAVTGGLFDND